MQTKDYIENRKVLKTPRTDLAEWRHRCYKYISITHADNRHLFARLLKRIKILHHIEGEAHGFIRWGVHGGGTYMQSLTTQRRHLKSFVSDLGCGMIYRIEKEPFRKHFLNLNKEVLDVYDRKSWANVIQKFNTTHLIINLNWSEENEIVGETESAGEFLQASFQSLLAKKGKQFQAHLRKMKKLRMIQINFVDIDTGFIKLYKLLQTTLQDMPTHFDLCLILGDSLQSRNGTIISGSGIHGKGLNLYVPKLSLPFITKNTANQGTTYKVSFMGTSPELNALEIEYRKIDFLRASWWFTKPIQSLISTYYLPESLIHLELLVILEHFIDFREDMEDSLPGLEKHKTAATQSENENNNEDPLEDISENDHEEEYTQVPKRYSLISTEKIEKFFNTSALTELQNLSICFSVDNWKTSYEDSVFAMVNQIPRLKKLKIGLACNFMESPVKLSSLVKKLESCLKTLELLSVDMEVSLEDFSENKEYFKNLKAVEFAGNLTGYQGLKPFLKSCENIEKINLFELAIDSKNLSEVLKSIATNIRAKILGLVFQVSGNIATEDFWSEIKYFIEKVGGVKWIWIEFEGNLQLKKEDVIKVRDALENSHKSFDIFKMNIGARGFVEFQLKDNSYVLTDHSFKKPKYTTWRISSDGHWEEVIESDSEDSIYDLLMRSKSSEQEQK